MLKAFWCTCTACEHEWPSDFSVEHGLLFAAYKSGEECPNCGSDVEVGDECEEGDWE